MSNAHTPGPWRITGSDAHGGMIHSDDGRIIAAWPYESPHSPESGQAMANARLIAAAPAMLDALRACVESLQETSGCASCHEIDCGSCGQCDCELSETLTYARAAIEQATNGR